MARKVLYNDRLQIAHHYCKYRTLKRKPLLLDPSTGGAKVQTSTAGGGSESVSFLLQKEREQPPRLHSDCIPSCADLRYSIHVWVIPIETKPIHGELWNPVRLLMCALPQFKRLHSWAMKARPRCRPWKRWTGCESENIQMVSVSLWALQQSCLLVRSQRNSSTFFVRWSCVGE